VTSINVSGKAEYRIVVDAKDWESIPSTKIRKELDEALENRAAKIGIFVTRRVEVCW
jgi:restriction endonuclease Mrr